MPNANGSSETRWRLWLALAFVITVSSSLPAQKHANDVPMPTQFDIGRHTYFDFGPPHDYYDLLLVRPAEQGTCVERLTLTPHGMGCVTAKFEVAHAVLAESIPALLGNVNPCKIPEKDLQRELKRCKHCPNFSGVVVTMQVPCGNETRLIRSDILDRDLFEAEPRTPEHTSWTMKLLATLDRPLPPGIWDRPVLSIPEGSDSRPVLATASSDGVLRDLSDGKYDTLFAGPDKVSELYREAQATPRPASVDIVSVTPVPPDVFVRPAYPLAGLTSQDGLISFTIHIDNNGNPRLKFTVVPDPAWQEAEIDFDSGNSFFFGVIRKAVAKWHFPKEAAGHDVHAQIRFISGCPKKTG
jgi:hypothetical protein